MSFLTAMIGGYVKETNAMARERAKKQREDELLADEFQRSIDLAKETSSIELAQQKGVIDYRIQKETDQAIAAWDREASNRESERFFEAWDSMTDNQKEAYLSTKTGRDTYSKFSGMQFGSDFSSLANEIANLDETTPLGQVTLPFTINTGKAEDVFEGVDKMELYIAQNPDFIKKVNDDEDTKRAVTALVGTLYNNYNAFWHDKFSTTGDDGKYANHAYRDWSKGLSKFSGLAKQLGIINQDRFNTAPVDLEKDQVFIPETQDTASNIGYVMPLAGIAEQYGTSSENITQLASYHEMTQGGSQIYSNIDYLTYGEDSKTDISDMLIDEDKMQSIAAGSALLSVGAKNIMLLQGGASKAVLDESTRLLTVVGRGSAELNYADEDAGAMRRAYFVITKPDSIYADRLPNHLTGVDGVTYANKQGYDVKGFREQNSATDEAVEMLQELVKLQSDYGATGLVAKVEAFALGVVGQAKQASDIFLSGDPVYDTFNQDLKEGTSASDLLETVKKYIPEERLEQLSKMDALRLTLAAKMARAVDPSGRLSNQDFEIQLQRLGGSGWFTDQKGALTKLNTVLEEFERRQTSNQDLLSIINKDNITVEDRRFIKASNAVNVAIAHRRKTQVRAETAAAPGQAVPESVTDMIPVPGSEGFFTKKGDNSVVYDANGKDVTDQWLAENYSDNDQGQQ
jgi:hypothetical protein